VSPAKTICRGAAIPFVDIRGQRIHYEDTGGTGPVLAFSHGLLMDASMWDAQVEELGGSYRCITWDERGHGQTGEASADFTYEDSADDLLGLLDSLGIARATLVGMSQGGYVTQRAAVRQPGIAQALVFISTQATEEEPAKVAVYDTLIDSWRAVGSRISSPRRSPDSSSAPTARSARSGSPSGSAWTLRACTRSTARW
jgi:pimeloyl-ACP methyl ester carboxylesterase